MKRMVIFLVCSIFSLSAIAVVHHATVRGTKVYKHRLYESGQMTVTHHHINAKPGTVHLATLEGENHYAVNEEHEGMDWLNLHTKGDIFQGGAHVYHQKTSEHMGLFQLHPGFYHLDIADMNRVQNMKGYKALKDLMGNRIKLIPPEGPGHYVGIQIYGPKDLKQRK